MNSRVLFPLVVLFSTSILVSINFSQLKNLALTNHANATAGSKKRKPKGFDHPLQFVLFHKDIRTPDDQIKPAYKAGYKMQELQHAKDLLRARRSQARGQSTIEWTERGPGNVPGRTRALLAIPHMADDVWLAGAATGGIWKTMDGGNTWHEKNDNLTSLPISSFAADKTFSRIYAGTGEFISTLFSAQGSGIFVSEDKGDTWSILPSTQGNADFSIVTRVIVDPDNANVLLATTVPSDLNARDNTSAIMRSSDGGATWRKAKEVAGAFEQIVYTPGNFNVQYASQNGVGVWKSVDAGNTWALANTGMEPSGRIELAVSPVNPAYVFASSQGTLAGAESDLYLSTDAAATWGLVNIRLNGELVDFLGVDPAETDSQGFYDNTILCDPFNVNRVYVGGVNLFQCTVGNFTGVMDAYRTEEVNTSAFLLLQSFANITHDNGRLAVGSHAQKRNVEIRFGPGLQQNAHLFSVPPNKTSGVGAGEYTYKNYVQVPFEVWDVTDNPRQLMVSFRDQNANDKFDLIPQYLTDNGEDYLQNSREYLYIHDVLYSSLPNTSISTNGGQEYNLMYTIFPALQYGASWTPSHLPASKVIIKHISINQYQGTAITVADAYSSYDGKNKVNQQNLDKGVHPDHHIMIPVITDEAAGKYKIILGNDGGVFVSDAATQPGTTAEAWRFKGFGYNTGQFYGADKRPNANQYIGGLQDNGTRISPAGESALPQTKYKYALGGDGFETLWHSRDENKLLATIYYGNIYRSTDAGQTWSSSSGGLSPGVNFPFFTKLANSKDYPDRVFTVSAEGVHRSVNFGASWTLTPIPNNFVTTSTSLLDVEVSRANANIVWAGSGMSNTAVGPRNLFVSEDGGQTFNETVNFSTVTMGSITKLASHPFEPHTAYALFSFADKPKILRTKNLGQSWEDISGFGTGTSSTNGFPDVAVYCLYVRPDNPEILWAGTEIGIMESLDNGANWSLRMDFPKVAVWDMKGQDNQVVMATHGRGIWTATLEHPQSNLVKAPVIKKTGISPKGELALRVYAEAPVDSVEIYVSNTLVHTLQDLKAGESDIFLDGISPGTQQVALLSYSGGVLYQSNISSIDFYNLLAVKGSYGTYFSSIQDFNTEGFFLKNFDGSTTGERKNLHTLHPYSIDQSYTASLLHPIKVSAELPKVFYKDVAIVEPENDYVILEATRNGLDWEPLTDQYAADASSLWENAFKDAAAGARAMLIEKEADLSAIFAAGDTILLQWRLASGPQTTAWGWAIDYIMVQQMPLYTEPQKTIAALEGFPNPTDGLLTIQYHLTRPSAIQLRLIDLSGKALLTQNVGRRDVGNNEEKISLKQFSNGAYLLVLHSEDSQQVFKVIVQR